MFIATCVLGAVLAALLVLSAYGKLSHNPEQTVSPSATSGCSHRVSSPGAAGIVLGLFWWPIGIAAGIGLVLYFALAVASHLRRKLYDMQASGLFCCSASRCSF
jgi:DoxX-like family